MKRKILLLIAAIVAVSGCVYARGPKVVNLEGEYTYNAPKDEPVKKSELMAVKMARIAALEQKFGRLMNSVGITNVKDSSLSFMMYGENEVRGEWISDNKDPEFTYLVDPEKGNNIIKVKVWFKAREIISNAVPVEYKILRNGTEPKFESDKFNSGDELYLYFKSPVDGYLVAYLLDESETFYRLLPYGKHNGGAYQIEGNKEYVFFSQNNLYNGERKTDVDEYVMTASRNVEFNFIYVLFSPNPIYRPSDMSGGQVDGKSVGVDKAKLVLPSSIGYEDFNKWLTKNRLNDRDMFYNRKAIEVYKK